MSKVTLKHPAVVLTTAALAVVVILYSFGVSAAPRGKGGSGSGSGSTTTLPPPPPGELLLNTSFEYNSDADTQTPDGWVQHYEQPNRSAKVVCNNSATGKCSYYTDGKKPNAIKQSVTYPAPVGSVVTISGWGKGQDVVTSSEPSGGVFWVQAWIHYTDGTTEHGLIANFASGTHDYQKASASFVAQKPVSGFTFFARFDKFGYVWFDDVSLSVQPPGTTITEPSNPPSTPPPVTTNPSFVVKTPVSGEVWAAGMKKKIEWTSQNYDGSVGLGLQDAQGGWNIVSKTNNTGYYTWTLPYTFKEGGGYSIGLVAVDTATGALLRDSSGNVLRWASDLFSIASTNPLSVSCSVTPLSQTANNTVTWNSVVSGGAGVYTYQWSGVGISGATTRSVTTTYPTVGNYVASVTVTSGTETQTASCGTVYIIPPPVPLVSLEIAPFVITADATSTLKWGSLYATQCTASGDWTGAKTTSGMEYVVPTTSTANYSLSCTGDGGTGSTNINDRSLVTTPVSGEVWAAGMKKTIQWEPQGYIGSVGLALQDSAGGWNIISETPNTGSYTWTLPHAFLAGDTYYIRVSVVGSPLSWISNFFSIAQAP